MNSRIALVIGSLESLAGGTEQHLLTLAEGLPGRGFDVDISCVAGTTFVASGGAPFPVRVLASGRKGRWRLESVRSLVADWRRERPSACVAYFDAAQFACVGASILLGALPVLAARRNLGVLRARHSLVEMKLLDRFVSRFVCNAEAVRRDVEAREGIPSKRTVVLYNGIDTRTVPPGDWRAAHGIGPEAVLVACVAGHRPVKGVDVFLKAFARAAAGYPQAMCVLAGDGPQRGELEAQVRASDLTGRVFFEGRSAGVRPLLAECQVGALSSHSEGFSTAVVEYMAAALPTVLTDVGGNSEAVREGVDGFLVPDGDEAMFGERLTRLLRDPALRRSMGESARERARIRFEREVMLDRMAEILREVTH